MPRGEPALVRADANEIDSVIDNLATNARDAMPDGGTLILRTAVVEQRRPGRNCSGLIAG